MVKLGETLVCETCGKEFIRTSYNHKHCSEMCRFVGWYSRRKEVGYSQKGVCPQCKNTFDKRSRAHKFCTEECRDEYYRNVKKPVFTEITCEFCGKPFTPHRINQKFCSPECASGASSMRYWKKIRPQKRVPVKSYIRCPICKEIAPYMYYTQSTCGDVGCMMWWEVEKNKYKFPITQCQDCRVWFWPINKQAITCGDPECRRGEAIKKAAKISRIKREKKKNDSILKNDKATVGVSSPSHKRGRRRNRPKPTV